jgi:hypothetical protein
MSFFSFYKIREKENRSCMREIGTSGGQRAREGEHIVSYSVSFPVIPAIQETEMDRTTV